MKFLCENFERYTAYHQQKSELNAADTLISDVIEFFSSRNYNTNIIDLLMQITTDCLDLDLNIFQNHCYIGIDLDPSKPKGMPLGLKLHTYSFTTKFINMAKA